MKKFILICGVWSLFLCTALICTGKSEIQYVIKYDTNTKETYALKAEIQSVYTELISGVNEESYMLMVLQNIEKFNCRDDVQTTYKNNRLTIIEGDGKGNSISGALKTATVCLPEVQPRSFLQELFSK